MAGLGVLVSKVAATACVKVDGACQGTGFPVVNASSHQLQHLLTLTFGILAALSVLFVVIGGLRLVISEGNPEDTAKARNTIIYAVVGLVIALSAEAIVAFVYGRIT